MCGVFGFVAKDATKRPSLETLKRVATATQRRGPHAWGMAWVDSRGRLQAFKQTGRVTDALGLLGMARDAVALIGHCRYATHGDPSNNLHNHPHPCDGGWMVHNGVVSGHQDMIDAHHLELMSDCDSEVLARLIEVYDGSLANRFAEAAATADQSPLVMMGLWARPGRLLLARNGNPLNVGQSKRGYYFGSFSDGLPGRAEVVKNSTVVEFTIPRAQNDLSFRTLAIPGQVVKPASKGSVTGQAPRPVPGRDEKATPKGTGQRRLFKKPVQRKKPAPPQGVPLGKARRRSESREVSV